MQIKTNWLEGRVKEVASLYHDLFGCKNITYHLLPDRVIFYSNGYFLASHKAMWREN